MTRIAVLAPFVLLALHATPALAQAPGDCACATPVVVTTVEAPRKIGVSLRLSALGIHPEAAPDDHTDLSGAGLAVSYRLTPRWGLELAAEQFTESQDLDAPRELQAASLSVTFHIRPRARWDLYGIAGLDAVGEAATDQQYGGAHLGAGVERRFRRFGLSAELRMLGLSEQEPRDDGFQKMETTTEPQALSGGQLSLAGTYYF